jgi:hypothetical protein
MARYVLRVIMASAKVTRTPTRGIIMRQFWKRVASFTCVLLSTGAVFAGGAEAQRDPTERSMDPPTAESIHGFTTITSVRELPGARILVADRGEGSLYLINWGTGAVDQVLRRGNGPGEYQYVGWLYGVGDNETIFTGTGRRWILLRDTQVVRTFVDTYPLNGRFRAPLDGMATGGAVLASVSAETPGSAVADKRVLELAPSVGPHERLPRLDTIRVIKGAGRGQLACVLGSTRGAPRCDFFESEEQAILFPDGWIAVALHDPYRVDWRSPDGAWIRGEALDDSVPVSEAEKCAAVYAWAITDGRCDEDAVASFAWPQTIPPFLTESTSCWACRRLTAGRAPWLFADPVGRLVVRRTPQRSRTGNVYDIIDRTGRRVARVNLPPREAIVGFGESSVYTIRMDGFDLQWLRRHAWRD